MRRVVLFLATVAVPLAIEGCGQTPIPPNLATANPMTQNDIVGGNVAVPYSWPWQVVWCSKGWSGGCELECGGTVVAPGWVITAGMPWHLKGA